jgi:hypothetical protein
LQNRKDNIIVVFMIPPFARFGLLPPGIHWANWDEFTKHFGWNEHRQSLLSGLGQAIECLASAGCVEVFIDGSFVTRKETPNDYDACWRQTGIDPERLDPVFLDFSNFWRAQKERFGGEFLIAETPADLDGATIFEYFQKEVRRGTVVRKGIIGLRIGADQ